jgi:DNA invertase Pin-like site-specific DNA recombinase
MNRMSRIPTAIYVYSAVADQEHVARQVSLCKALAYEKGCSIVDVYEDEGKRELIVPIFRKMPKKEPFGKLL